jgi:DNA-binding transcriptional LysR family regulator
VIAVTIDELETFVSIARRGGFARAAESLHRSQPAISRRVEMLEQQLGSPLFERVRGGVILTEAGRTLLPYAEAALAGLKDGAEACGVSRAASGARSPSPWWGRSPAPGSRACCASSPSVTPP